MEARNNYAPWTAGQDAYLRENFESFTYKNLGKELGRTVDSIRQRLKHLELKRSPEANRRLVGGSTKFQKGQKPVTMKPIGSITIRIDSRGNSYKWIKVAENEWIPLHRYNWQEENGRIPEGYNVLIGVNPLELKKGQTDCLRLVSDAENATINRWGKIKEREEALKCMEDSLAEARRILVHKKASSLLEIPALKRHLVKFIKTGYPPLDVIIKQAKCLEPKRVRNSVRKGPKTLDQRIGLEARKKHTKKKKRIEKSEEAQERSVAIRAAFKARKLSITGSKRAIQRYINHGTGSIEDILRVAKEKQVNQVRQKKVSRKPNAVIFNYDPSNPKSREEQLIAFMKMIGTRDLGKRHFLTRR